MKIETVIVILFCCFSCAAQEYSIQISDNGGKQYSSSEYIIKSDSLIIKGLSDYGQTRVEYLKRPLTKPEQKVVSTIRLKYPTSGFASEYFSDYSNFSYISADNYPRVITLVIEEKGNSKKIKITNSYVRDIAAMISDLNVLFPPEVRIIYKHDDFAKSY